MSRHLPTLLVLALVLAAAGCAAPEESAPSDTPRGQQPGTEIGTTINVGGRSDAPRTTTNETNTSAD